MNLLQGAQETVPRVLTTRDSQAFTLGCQRGEHVLIELDAPDRKANNLGVKGLGEPPIIPAAAAIANAVANATGARIRHSPMTRARVLEALALVEAR